MTHLAWMVFSIALMSVVPGEIEGSLGLEVSLVPLKTEYELGEPIPFRVQFRNTSERGFSVNVIPTIGPKGLEILARKGDKVWVSEPQILDRPRDVLRFRNVPLAPGYGVETPVFKMGPSIYSAEMIVPISDAGIYLLQVRYTARETDQPPAVCPLWVGSTTSAPVQILVKPPSSDVLSTHIAVLRDFGEDPEAEIPEILATMVFFSIVKDPTAAVELRKILDKSEFSEPILPVLLTAISNQGTQEDLRALASFLDRPEVPPYIRLLIDGAIQKSTGTTSASVPGESKLTK